MENQAMLSRPVVPVQFPAAVYMAPQRFTPMAIMPTTTTSSTQSSVTSTNVEESSAAASYSHISCANLGDGEFVRDPLDCGVFYTCFMGKPSKRSKCDAGLAFDSSIKVCNWKAQVEC